MTQTRFDAETSALLYGALDLMVDTFIGGLYVSDRDYALAISSAEEALRTARGETQEQQS